MNSTSTKKFVATSAIACLLIAMSAQTARSETSQGDEGEDLATWHGQCEVVTGGTTLTGNCIGPHVHGHGLRMCTLKSLPSKCPTTTSVTDKTHLSCGAGSTSHSVSPSHACS